MKVDGGVIILRYIVWYFKSCFCNHTWKKEESEFQENNIYDYKNVVVSVSCNKCEWHRKYIKYPKHPNH